MGQKCLRCKKIPPKSETGYENPLQSAPNNNVTSNNVQTKHLKANKKNELTDDEKEERRQLRLKAAEEREQKFLTRGGVSEGKAREIIQKNQQSQKQGLEELKEQNAISVVQSLQK
eukprot:Platyproteum_vivax@DN1822_c0_g1_i1.p1